MVVLVLTACPPGLRGYLTRWLLEISAGVFVGKVSKKVRLLLWEAAVPMVGNGRAILVYQENNEQGLAFLVHGHHWEPIDVEGISLMLKPDPEMLGRSQGSAPGGETQRKTGWSKASRRRRFG